MSYLLVPMDVQALVVGRYAEVPCLGPLHSFRRLPGRDASGGRRRPYIGADLAAGAASFGKTHRLAAGIHLHWRLPAALCHGIEEGETLSFPLVPNRWLVTRMRMAGANSPMVQGYEHWIVESDTIDQEWDRNRRGFPHPTVPMGPEDGHGWRRIGRQMRLADWLKEAPLPPGRRLPGGLTSQGYGDPSFAAYYPSSATVFGFFDPADEIDAACNGQNTAWLAYHVSGWYHDPAKEDPLGKGAVFRKGLAGFWAGWDPTGPVDRTLCHGGRPALAWNGRGRAPAAENGQPAFWKNPTCRLGLSPQAAQAAGLAAHFGAAEVEADFNLLQFSAVDGQTLQDRMHEAGFRQLDPGCHWVLKRTDGVASGHGQQLPSDLAIRLGKLNAKQRSLNNLRQSLVSRQRQLFGDWYKSLMILYSHDVPDLYRQHAEAVAVLLDKSCLDIFEKITEKATLLCEVLAELGLLEQSDTRYKVVEAPEPRFWRPLDPILCLIGEGAAKPRSTGKADPLQCRPQERITETRHGVFTDRQLKGAAPPLGLLAGLITDFAKAAGTRNAAAGWEPLFLHYEAAFDRGKGHLRRYRGVSRMVPAGGASFLTVLAGMEARLKNEQKSLSVDEQERRRLIDGELNKLSALRTAFDALPPLYLPSLNGLYDNFLMLSPTLQMQIADPYAAGPRRAELEAVRLAVEGETSLSPLPRLPFRPWTKGRLSLSRLRLADAFGRFVDHPVGNLGVPPIDLPGRLAQAARLQFRWAPRDETAVTAVVAWILVNFVDDCLDISDGAGVRIGRLHQVMKGKQRVANWVAQRELPGSAPQALKDFIASLGDHRGDAPVKRAALIEEIEKVLLSGGAAEDGAGLASLLGRPLAVVEANLSLELMGDAASDQSWAAFKRRLETPEPPEPPPSGRYEPVTIDLKGNGLVGLWAPQNDRPAALDFQTLALSGGKRKPDGKGALQLTPGEKKILPLTLLIDPFRTIEVQSRILPTKTVGLPDYMWDGAAAAMTLTVGIFPLLAGPPDASGSKAGRIRLVEPAVDGGAWEWLPPGDTKSVPVADIGNGEDDTAFSAVTLSDGELLRRPQ